MSCRYVCWKYDCWIDLCGMIFVWDCILYVIPVCCIFYPCLYLLCRKRYLATCDSKGWFQKTHVCTRVLSVWWLFGLYLCKVYQLWSLVCICTTWLLCHLRKKDIQKCEHYLLYYSIYKPCGLTKDLMRYLYSNHSHTLRIILQSHHNHLYIPIFLGNS